MMAKGSFDIFPESLILSKAENFLLRYVGDGVQLGMTKAVASLYSRTKSELLRRPAAVNSWITLKQLCALRQQEISSGAFELVPIRV